MKHLIIVAATSAFAGNYTTTPLGNGWSVTTGDDDTSVTTMPLGNGWSTTTTDDGE